MGFIERALIKNWYRSRLTGLTVILLPLSFIYRLIIYVRKFLFRFKNKKLNIPIIIVGNITLGGTGKTPCVIEIIKLLKSKGYSPGVISRGYGGYSKKYPLLINSQSNPKYMGDEPCLIFQKTGVPIVVDPNRLRAANYLTQLASESVDIIISDDGLSHYKLPRDIELVLFDTQKKFGNQQCLPAGPLREPMSRLKSVDFCVETGVQNINHQNYQMAIKNPQIINILSQKSIKNYPKNSQWILMAGLAFPEKFFNYAENYLKKYNIDNIIKKSFSDHYDFSEQDFKHLIQNYLNKNLNKNKINSITFLITEKDAVKLNQLDLKKLQKNVLNQYHLKIKFYTLSISAEFSEKFLTDFLNKIKKLNI